ncbi:MAG: hypothetical protein QOK07_993 [Gemmatimonadaceae bacterium]|nr:hypothetical protein [Gemmatimonadaceae bacterium]
MARSSTGETLRSRLSETDGGGWGLVASVIFKITVTLLRKVGWVRFPHSPAISLAVVLLCTVSLTPRVSEAQQRDSGRVGIAPPTAQSQPGSRADSTPRPPMSPRRAFLTSLLLPGYAQTVFGRDRAAMLFTIIEIGSIGMARKSALDLAEARALAHDSVVATYKIDPTTGLAIKDPKTNLPIPETWIASRYTPDRIKARRTHYEDWIAAILFNHLFSGADAYVAANLWDFKTNIGAVSSARSVTVYASVNIW